MTNTKRGFDPLAAVLLDPDTGPVACDAKERRVRDAPCDVVEEVRPVPPRVPPSVPAGILSELAALRGARAT